MSIPAPWQGRGRELHWCAKTRGSRHQPSPVVTMMNKMLMVMALWTRWWWWHCQTRTTNRGRVWTLLKKGNLVTGLVVGGSKLHRHAVHLLALLHLVRVVILENMDLEEKLLIKRNVLSFRPPPHRHRRDQLCRRLQEYRGGTCRWMKSWTNENLSDFQKKGPKCKEVKKGKTHLVCWPASGPELNLMLRLFLRMSFVHHMIHWFGVHFTSKAHSLLCFSCISESAAV